MSLLNEPTPPPSRRGRRLVLAILLLAGAVAGSLVMFRSTEPAPEPEPLATPGRAEPRPVEPPAAVEAAPVAPAPADPEPTAPASPPAGEPASSIPTTQAPIVLRVTSDVEGADVFIDRQYVGKTPFESSAVAAGPHRLNVSAPGYDGFSQTIEIGEDLVDLSVAFTVVRLDEQVPVVHKHRFGDCTGLLVANLDGIRYDTEDDDAFTVALDDLDEFAVDYLEQNLRLKVRDGRAYNFTHEDAERLFVFHREVERARERLR